MSEMTEKQKAATFDYLVRRINGCIEDYPQRGEYHYFKDFVSDTIRTILDEHDVEFRPWPTESRHAEPQQERRCEKCSRDQIISFYSKLEILF